MKKIYIKPSMEIEKYELSQSIANNCITTVKMGPGVLNHPEFTECDDYYEKAGEDKIVGIAAMSLSSNVDFWTEDSCDCYYSAGGTFFTS